MNKTITNRQEPYEDLIRDAISSGKDPWSSPQRVFELCRYAKTSMFAAKRPGGGACLFVLADPNRCYWPDDIGEISLQWEIDTEPAQRLEIHLDYYSMPIGSKIRISLDATSCLLAGTLLHDFLKAACDDGRLELAFEGDPRPIIRTSVVDSSSLERLRGFLKGLAPSE